MGGRANAADPAGDLRHVLGRSAEAEHFEPAQLGDLQVGAFDVALVIEKDVDLAVAFEAGDRIDGDPAALADRARRWPSGWLRSRLSAWPGSWRVVDSLRCVPVRGRQDPLCGATGSWPGRSDRRCRPGRECPRAWRRFPFRPLAATLAQRDERIFAPWSRTREVGPKQPVQGMPPQVQAASQPARVAGPMQTTPCARKQVSGSMSVRCGRLNSVKLRSAGLVALRWHWSQRAMSGASTLPFGGRLPESRRADGGLGDFGRGRAAGDVVIDVHDLVERADHMAQLGQGHGVPVLLAVEGGPGLCSFTTVGASSYT